MHRLSYQLAYMAQANNHREPILVSQDLGSETLDRHLTVAVVHVWSAKSCCIVCMPQRSLEHFQDLAHTLRLLY